MRTLLALASDEPVLYGRLGCHRFGPDRGRPTLSLAAWCPWCKDRHAADVPEALAGRLDIAIPINAPCRVGAFAGRTIHLVIDPDHAAEARRTIRHHGQALRRFLVERRLRHQFAESRRHAREWDVLPTAGA